MKVLILTALIAAVVTNPVSQETNNWPWQVGKVYHYDVYSHTLTNFEESTSHGSAYKAQFIIRVKTPGRLLAKLENSLYAPVKDNITFKYILPSSLNYKPFPKMDQIFEIFVKGGRVISLNVSSTLSVTYTNFLKGLVSALQVDLSPVGHIPDYPNSFDRTTFQGLFKKMETDVTGTCETLYSVSPVPAEWRRELPTFSTEEDPVEIIKGRNYNNCDKRANVYAGVPKSFQDTKRNNGENQMFKHTYEARLVVGKRGPIYKAKASSSAVGSPFGYGKQKAEVFSYVRFFLRSVEQDNSWQDTSEQKLEKYHALNTLLYSYDNSTSFTYGDQQIVASAQRLLQEMITSIQYPSNMLRDKFLLKFNTLVHMVYSFNSKQLAQMTASIENAKTSKNIAKSNIWIIYRDAVAAAGTTETYEQIIYWILNKKIEGQEAADVITALGASLSNPSNHLIKDFFKFASNPVVKELKFVNNSVLLASSKLLRLAEDKQFIDKTVIPYFDEQLRLALANGDTNKAQVYIRVLGNLCHPSILKVYAPYLEGHITVTKYLRTQMVISLRELASLRNDYVRAVLYSMIMNTAESYEVRVAAVHNIFLANPTPEMMQVFVHLTHADPSAQVRAVLTNSIIYAANLKNPRFREVAKTAQSFRKSITKETFNSLYSMRIMTDEYSSDEEYNYFDELVTIGSKNSFLPKYLRSAFRFNGVGVTEGNEVTFSVSDMKDLIDFFMKTLYEEPKVDPKFKFSAEDIIKMLNIRRPLGEPLEGSLFIDFINKQAYYTFNENELRTFIEDIIKSIVTLTGTNAQYTKMGLSKNIKISFPIASGMLFEFEYVEPTFVKANANIALQIDLEGKSISGSLKTKLDFTIASQEQGTISFLDIFRDQWATAGVSRAFQFYSPLDIRTEFNPSEIKLSFQPLYTDNDVNLVQFNVVPFTGIYNRHSVTYDQEPIKRKMKTLEVDVNFGHATGLLYQIQGHSYSSNYKDLKALFSDDPIKSLFELLYLKDIAFTEFNFKYLAKETEVKSVDFTLYFETLYNQNILGEMGLNYSTKHVEPNSVARRQEITKKVSSGIPSAVVQLYDFTAQFNGPKTVVFLFTSAYAYSLIGPKFQAAFFAHSGKQISGVFKLNTENTIKGLLNFKEALNNNVTVTYEADIKYRDNNLHLKGYGKRSEEYTERLKKDPMAERCLRDIRKQNFFQKECYNMTVKSYTPDYFKAVLTYNFSDPTFLSLFGYTYKEFLQSEFSLEEQSDTLVKIDDNRMEINAQAFYYDNYINFNFLTKRGSFNLKNVESSWDSPYIMSVYAPLVFNEDTFDWSSDYSISPYCAVDDNKVKTFSGRSYDYSLTGSWHVVMVDNSNLLGQGLLILARRPRDKHAEVYVSYKTDGDKFFELYVKPESIEVNSNCNKTYDGVYTMYWDDEEEMPLLEYYYLSNDTFMFVIQEIELRLVYDKHRLVVLTTECYGSTNGICGQSSTETRDDYMTPWGLVDLPEYYGSSFSLEGEYSNPKTVALKKEAKLKSYQPVTKFTSILRSDEEWKKAQNVSL